jgi:hydrogenase-4 component B
MNTFALWFAVAAPLALALLWLAPGGRPTVVRLAPWAALPAGWLALLGPTDTSIELGWIMFGTRLGLDATGQVFLFFTALLWGVCSAFGRAYLADDPGRERFFLFHLLAMSGNFGLILALDAPGFYACFALMSFSSYGLVIHQRSPEALRAGRIYLYLVVLGELMLFAALVLICAPAGSTRLPVAAGPEISPLAFGLVVAGFGIKAGLLPLHVWLPLVYPVAPTPASAVLSGAMSKAGLIGWLRFLPLGQSTGPAWGGLLAVLGLSAAFFGVMAGLAQRNPKTVLAYSSISQMGLITLGVGASLLSPENGSAFQGAVLLLALHHGLAKGALFLGVGVAQAAGTRHRTWVGIGLLLPALALAGAPWTSGALAKTALKSATGGLPAAWADALAVLLPLAAIGTTLLMARFLILVWPRESDEGHLNAGLVVPWGGLLAAVALTFYGWPVVVERAGIGSGLSAAWTAAWTAAWPVLAGAVLSWAAWKWGRGWAGRAAIPAGDLLALVEAAASWLRRHSPARSTTTADPAVTRGAGKVPGWLATGDRLVNHLRRGEAGLQRWSVAGVVFLSVVATLVLLLIAVG